MTFRTGRESARHRIAAIGAMLALGAAVLTAPVPARGAGQLSWLDEIIQQAIAESRTARRTADDGAQAAARAGSRLLVREADESLAAVAKRYDDVARVGRTAPPSDAVLEMRFKQLANADRQAAETFAKLAPAEKRLVVEMGETAQQLARRSPDQAESLIKSLGVEGLAAVRVYGDDVAEVIAKEGPQSINVLRKTGRGGWSFFTNTVLPHKKKLAAAGVFALFLANPEKFIDSTGRVTQFAVEQFGKAGVQLIGAVGQGVAQGAQAAVDDALGRVGFSHPLIRGLTLILAGVVAVGSLLVIFGMPVRWLLKPILVPLGFLRRAFPFAFAPRTAAAPATGKAA